MGKYSIYHKDNLVTGTTKFPSPEIGKAGAIKRIPIVDQIHRLAADLSRDISPALSNRKNRIRTSHLAARSLCVAHRPPDDVETDPSNF